MRYYFTRPGTAGLPKGRDWMKNLYKAGMGRFAAICLVVLMVFSTGNLYAFADEAGNGDTSTSSAEDGGDTGSTVSATAADAEVPEQPADLYVYDEASVISASTKTVINDKNADLNATYGVQIAVFTMNTLPGEKSDYDGRVAYLKKVMDTWKLGGDSKNGLIIGLSVSDGDYMAVAGDGLHGAFSGTELSALLHDNLEADFQTGAYDAGVLKLFNAVAAAAETYKSGNPTDSAAVGTASNAESAADGTESSAAESSASSEASGPKGGSVIFGVLKFVLVLVIVFAVLLLIVYIHGQRVRKKRREARRRRAEQRRRAAEQETADPYTAPRKEEPKRTLEDDYLDFMNRYK